MARNLLSTPLRLLAPANSDVMPRALLRPHREPATRLATIDVEAEALVIYYPWHNLNPPMTQGYHSGHPAYDWALPMWTPYYAPIDGVLRYGNASGYAYHLTITNAALRLQCLLAHMPAGAQAKAGLSSGVTVRAGQLVGYSDNTGYSTGPHCHMEMRRPPYNGYASCFDFRQYLRTWTGEPTPPPEPEPEPEPIKAGDVVSPQRGWYIRWGDTTTGKGIKVTAAADESLRLPVVRVANGRAVVEVSIAVDGVERV